MPLFELVGKAAKAVPEHIGATAVNVGVVFGFTIIVKVVVVAHCPAVGVKVYFVVVVLFRAGDQVPVMPLLEVVGRFAKKSPSQIGGTGVKIAIVGFTTTVISTVAVAHCPAVGVKVYFVVVVLFGAGDQVPVIPLLEVVGRFAKASPSQIGGTGVKMAVIGFTTTVIVIVAVTGVHCPRFGVKV